MPVCVHILLKKVTQILAGIAGAVNYVFIVELFTIKYVKFVQLLGKEM